LDENATEFSVAFVFLGGLLETLRHPHSVDQNVWTELERAMSVEPSIMGSRATAANLERIYRDGRAVLLWNDGEPIGFIAAWEWPEGYLEIGSAWVDARHRGLGHGNRLVVEIAKLVRALAGDRAFSVTTNPRFVAAALKAGLRLHEDWIAGPIPWAVTCGKCDFFAESDKPGCPKRNATCRLLL